MLLKVECYKDRKMCAFVSWSENINRSMEQASIRLGKIEQSKAKQCQASRLLSQNIKPERGNILLAMNAWALEPKFKKDLLDKS